MAQTTVKLGEAEKEAFERLQRELKRFGRKANREEIVAAMLHGVTPAQLHGMLAEYIKDE